MEDTFVKILVIGTAIALGFSVNLAAFAIRRYLRANRMHEVKRKRKYEGALPKHIWKTAVGNLLMIVALGFYVFSSKELSPGLVLSFVGFSFLAEGMRELLSLENRRIEELESDTTGS